MIPVLIIATIAGFPLFVPHHSFYDPLVRGSELNNEQFYDLPDIKSKNFLCVEDDEKTINCDHQWLLSSAGEFNYSKVSAKGQSSTRPALQCCTLRSSCDQLQSKTVLFSRNSMYLLFLMLRVDEFWNTFWVKLICTFFVFSHWFETLQVGVDLMNQEGSCMDAVVSFDYWRMDGVMNNWGWVQEWSWMHEWSWVHKWNSV